MPEQLQASKAISLRIESVARRHRIGEHAPRGVRTLSAGLLRIGTILAASGYPVRFLPLEDLRQLLDQTPASDAPTVVGFGAFCPTVPACAALAEEVRKRFPGTRVALGGAHAAVAGDLTRRRYPVFHQVIPVFEEAAAGALVGRLPQEFARPLLELDYDLLPHPVAEYGLNLMTAMGCPFTCMYCQEAVAPWTHRPLDGGLADVMGQLPLRTPVHYCDSVLGGSPTRALQVCKALAALGHGMLLSCDLRPEYVRPGLLEALVAAGFVEIRVGLDSADEAVLAATGRSARPAQLPRALELVRELTELYVSVYLVTGLPGTTPRTLDQNLDVVHQLLSQGLADQIRHNLYVPYPTDSCPSGHPDVRLLTDDWARYDRHSYPVFELEGIEADRLWASFLAIEEAINVEWMRSLDLCVDDVCRVPMYPDSNGAMSLDRSPDPILCEHYQPPAQHEEEIG
ncbi:MAG: B12-binding domain-containing radical SAM protein [Egibacteraceae bacterium]